MIQISRNEIIGSGNQKLTISLMSGGVPVIPTELLFTIYEINSPTKVLTPVKVIPEASDKQPVDIYGSGKIGDGDYRAIFQMTSDASLGRAKIVWYYKTHSSQPDYTTFEEEFDILDHVDVYGSSGPPAVPISEIRSFLRDTPEYHVLIDGMLFKDSEIMTAVNQTVSRFNRMNPPIGEYSVYNFPDRYLLTIGVAGWLLESEANRQLMEQLTYQDGNIHHGITDKTQLYRQAAAAFKEEFTILAKDIKMQININGIYTGDGMGVRFRYNRYYGGKITA